MFNELLSRGVAEVVDRGELVKRLVSGKAMRLKMGFDPTAPQLHVGHTVGLRKLREFQDLGHKAVLVVGDWTARVGDPTGRDAARRPLSAEEVGENAETYLRQFLKIVDESLLEIRYQSEWYGGFELAHVAELLSQFTVQQLLGHDTFRSRVDSGKPLTLLELMYPILQAYDSIVVGADVEFGGMDQKFNILAGRELMKAKRMAPQQMIVTPLLLGTDGRKMSKSFANTIDLEMAPEEMYGRTMSISDDLMRDYYLNATALATSEIDELFARMRDGGNPRDVKMRLARALVSDFHGPEAVAAAEEHFTRVVRRGQAPADVGECSLELPMGIVEVLVRSAMVGSRNEARRMIGGGGVYIDGDRISDPHRVLEGDNEVTVRVGRRKYMRIVPK